jgi:hypothetical protein
MIIGISDVQQEYIEDIAYLEQLLINTGPMPLSHILQHLQKVFHVLNMYTHIYILILYLK